MLFESILFDLDDTLHDRNKSLCKFIDLFKLQYFDAIDDDSNINLKDVFLKIDRKGYRPREEMFNELQNIISWKFKPDLQELINFWNIEFPKCAEPMDNLYSTLNIFLNKNIKMGIVTNGDSDFQNTKIDKLDLRKYMKVIIISQEVNIRKPDPKIFQLALSRINSRNGNTLYVGDNPSTDIKGAFDAGLTTVWLSCGETWNIEQYKPRYIINNIYELINLF